jgi:hypothetical protein
MLNQDIWGLVLQWMVLIPIPILVHNNVAYLSCEL